MSGISAYDDIIEAVLWGLVQIKTSSGYNTTIKHAYDPEVSIDEVLEYPSVLLDEGSEDCANSNIGSHLQTGGNEAGLHNSFDLSLHCCLNEVNNAREARNKIKADIQKYFGLHPRIPNSFGVDTAFNCFYRGATPWGVDKQKPLTGITVDIRVWYRQKLTDPTTTI
jgi:hypothetical protein